jgi:MFS family permease
MQITTIGLQVYYEFTAGMKDYQRFYVLGEVGLYEAIPFIITSFFSGHIADIFSRKKIIISSVFFLALGSAFLVLFNLGYFPGLFRLGYYPLLFVVALFGILRSFNAAASPPLVSMIVPRSLYANSTTWNSTIFHLCSILGPALAGLIYGYHEGKNSVMTYSINTGLFVLAVVGFLLIKNSGVPGKKTKDESIMQSLSAGIKFVFQKKIILSALSLDLFAVLFGGAVAMLPAFADKILDMGPQAAGTLRTAPAVGAVLMAIVISIKPPAKNAGKLLLISVIAFGLFTICFALSKSYWLAFFFLMLTGAFDNISVVIRHTILQLMTPENMRGRVSAVNGIFIGSSNEIGSYESGLAARILGLVPSIIFGGAMVIAVVTGVNFLNPSLKKLDMGEMEKAKEE